MLVYQVIGCATKLSLEPEGYVYYFGQHFPRSTGSLESFQDTSLWRNYYQPFAAAIVNKKKHEIVLVRDHFGFEPLYYCFYLGKTLLFGQSIPDILAALPSTPPLLESQLNHLFSEHKYYSDETLYQGIYRVEPGTLMHFKLGGFTEKQYFWQLNPEAPKLQYDDVRDYSDHFSALLHEATLNALDNQKNIAAEFSAGLDSSAIYCAARSNHCAPTLYMHMASPKTEASRRYDDSFEKRLIQYFQIKDIHRIDANQFDPLKVFTEYAHWFAGPTPYIFPMFSNPIHQAVAAGQHPILLSGFGGDQCVTGQVSTNFLLPELIHQGKHKEAWHEIRTHSLLKTILRYVKYMNVNCYEQSLNYKKLKQQTLNMFRGRKNYQSPTFHPYEYIYYPSVSAVEASLLQGRHCHETRMRIEYSALIGKKMGFQYRYPLLYPKLVEYVLSIPTQQKRLDGKGRYLIRNYLSENISENIFAHYKKKNGLGIVPSAFNLYQSNLQNGVYDTAFQDLPYSNLIRNKCQGIESRHLVKGFMLKQMMTGC